MSKDDKDKDKKARSPLLKYIDFVTMLRFDLNFKFFFSLVIKVITVISGITDIARDWRNRFGYVEDCICPLCDIRLLQKLNGHAGSLGD